MIQCYGTQLFEPHHPGWKCYAERTTRFCGIVLLHPCWKVLYGYVRRQRVVREHHFLSLVAADSIARHDCANVVIVFGLTPFGKRRRLQPAYQAPDRRRLAFERSGVQFQSLVNSDAVATFEACFADANYPFFLIIRR